MFRSTCCYTLPLISNISKLKFMKNSGDILYCLDIRRSNLPKTFLCRFNSTKKSVTKLEDESGGEITSFNQKVKQTTKDVYYSGIIVVGVLITGTLGYTIFRELFSSDSPNGVYTRAFKMCKEDHRIIDALGEPIKGFGETTGRGRRRHVSQAAFEQDGVQCMRMKFYIKGSRKQGTVHLEVRKNSKGKFEFRYLFVELNDFVRETIILEDNR